MRARSTRRLHRSTVLTQSQHSVRPAMNRVLGCLIGMKRLDERAIKRLSGPSWTGLRRQFEKVHEALTSVSPSARGELTTIYVKYVADETRDQPFAVVWLKKSTELVVGLALPDGYELSALGPPLPGYKYAGLTAFLRITSQDIVPPQLAQSAHDAHENVRSARP